MPRLRLGVVLLLPPPLDAEIDALRRALGDGTLGRVPAHLTLVPPVNVREDRVADALRVMREAAAASRPVHVGLGAPATFLPDNPTLYLPVDNGTADVLRLRDRVFREPLARPLTWPYVAHVTVADEVPPERIAAAEVALAQYRAEITFQSVHLMREEPGRVWTPWAEAPLGPPAVVGRGGLPLELSVTSMLDPEAQTLLSDPPAAPKGHPLCITGRREGAVAGAAVGWTAGGVGHIDAVVVAPVYRDEGIARHLLAAFESAATARGATRSR